MSLNLHQREVMMAADGKELKQYAKPEVVEELDLETRAGSPTISEQVNPLDLP